MKGGSRAGVWSTVGLAPSRSGIGFLRRGRFRTSVQLFIHFGSSDFSKNEHVCQFAAQNCNTVRTGLKKTLIRAKFAISIFADARPEGLSVRARGRDVCGALTSSTVLGVTQTCGSPCVALASCCISALDSLDTLPCIYFLGR